MALAGKRFIGKMKNTDGFSLAELLIMVAVLTILAGFGFVSLVSFQNKLRLKEADDTAKAIFMASQYHLTCAWAAGRLEAEAREHPVASDEEIYFGYALGGGKYLTCSYEGHRGGNRHEADDVVSQLLLPFGSIDETVRSGFSYAIVYNRQKAAVQQVFCCRGSKDLSDDELVRDLLADPAYLDDPKRDTQWRVKMARASEVNGERMYLGYYGT